MEYSKIFEALNKIFYLIGKQGVLVEGHRKHKHTQRNHLKLVVPHLTLSLPKNCGPELVSAVAFFKRILQVVFSLYMYLFIWYDLFVIILEWISYFGARLFLYLTPLFKIHPTAMSWNKQSFNDVLDVYNCINFIFREIKLSPK